MKNATYLHCSRNKTVKKTNDRLCPKQKYCRLLLYAGTPNLKICGNHVLYSDQHNIPPDKHTILSDEQTILSDEQIILSDEQTILSDEHTILSDEHTILSD